MPDCCIIGGGVIGLSLAYDLAGRGVSVRVVERGDAGREASWAGAGILPPAVVCPEVPAMEKLGKLSSRLHQEWPDRLQTETGIDNGYRPCGGIHLVINGEDAAELERYSKNWSRLGVVVEKVAGESLRKLEPRIADSISTGYFLRGEAQLRNPRHLKALHAACVARGVAVSTGVAVHEFKQQQGKIVAIETSDGLISSGQFCICAGAWSGPLLARLGQIIPIRPIRGQIALFGCDSKLLVRIINHRNRYLVPRPDGRLLVGSTEEDAGFDKRNTGAGIAGLLRFAIHLVPQLDGQKLESYWAGLRPGTPDGLPYLGKVPGTDNAFVAAGHFRAGLHLSTGTATVMGQLICGEPPEIDLAAFRLGRADSQ